MSHLRLHDLFVACDTQANGRIGPPEFQQLCLNFGISPADANTIFADLDHDRDGAIDFNDFSHGFRDFLTPGSRRGSLQLPAHLQDSLAQMELRHADARPAWKHFTTNVGISNVKPFIPDTGQELVSIVEEIRGEQGAEVGLKLEKALGSLISDVQTLHDEYKTLETSFRKEKETHAAQLAALGEELDQQLAKTEAKAKAEARHEAQRQMDAERKKIAMEMETQMAELGAQLKTFQKVEEWLTEEERRSGPPSLGAPLDSSKLVEAESENRSLKSALAEAQMKAALLQSQLSQKRNEYQELVTDFHTEKLAAVEYKTQVDLMQNHLSILSQANRVLSDANDCFSMAQPPGSSPSTPPDDTRLRSPTPDIDRDSGRGTLLEELRAEEGKSPLPSGVWPPPVPPGGGGGCCSGGVDSKRSSTYRSFEEETPERAFKVILAGDAAVGKTTFIERVCQGHFTPNLSSTIGVDFRVKTLEVDGGTVALQLWDTAGQERFRSLTKSYFRRADGVILMYDVTNEGTFVSIRHWAQNVEEGAGRQLPIVLCGNKSDLRCSAIPCVSSADGAKLASLCGAQFLETSPKRGSNVTEALLLLAREMRKVEDLEVANSVRLEETKKRGGCCT